MTSYWDRFIERYGLEEYIRFRYQHPTYPCMDMSCKRCEVGVRRLLRDLGLPESKERVA